MFKKILVDLHAEIEMPRPRWVKNLEEVATELEYDAKELTEFIRDHRSRDDYQINIVHEYKTVCAFCGFEEERDDEGVPVCCGKAIEEYQKVKESVALGGKG